MARADAAPGRGVEAPPRGHWRWLALSVVVIVSDQLSKRWIEAHLQNFETRVILPVFNLVRAHNRGVAFSMFNDAGGWQRWAFSALALGVSVALFTWLLRLERAAQLQAASLALILAGALGNLVDRLRLGMVVDFLQLHWRDHYFPAFNVADSAITIGACGLLLDALLSSHRAAGH